MYRYNLKLQATSDKNPSRIVFKSKLAKRFIQELNSVIDTKKFLTPYGKGIRGRTTDKQIVYEIVKLSETFDKLFITIEEFRIGKVKDNDSGEIKETTILHLYAVAKGMMTKSIFAQNVKNGMLLEVDEDGNEVIPNV